MVKISIPDTRMLIAGERIPLDEKRTIPVVSPLTGNVLASVSDATPEQVATAIESAELAFRTWRKTSGAERSNFMHRLADLLERDADTLARLESADTGKLLRETQSQAQFTVRNYRFFAGIADKIYGHTIPLDAWDTLDYTKREPVGVAVLITAWNSPMQLLANKLAPALAAGCTVVIKPSEIAPLTTLYLSNLLEEAGFPPGVINIVTGGKATGVALTTDARVGRISFTGSVETGRAIAKAAAGVLVPVTLELGGKSANIVFSDADLERAASGVVAGIFSAGGQTCIAGSRLLVHESIADDFMKRLVNISKTIKLGDPQGSDTQMGPVASIQQQSRILSMISAAKDEEASLVLGGGVPDNDELSDGAFVEPTIFANVHPESQLAQEEVFGPVLAVMTFSTDEEAVELANNTQFALAAGVWSQNVQRAHRMARDLQAGTIWINTYRYSAAQAPFGGSKQSGYGRERGLEALEEYLHTKNVLMDLSDEVRDPFAIKV